MSPSPERSRDRSKSPFDWPFYIAFACVLVGLGLVIFGSPSVGRVALLIGALVLFVLGLLRRVSILEWIRIG